MVLETSTCKLAVSEFLSTARVVCVDLNAHHHRWGHAFNWSEHTGTRFCTGGSRYLIIAQKYLPFTLRIHDAERICASASFPQLSSFSCYGSHFHLSVCCFVCPSFLHWPIACWGLQRRVLVRLYQVDTKTKSLTRTRSPFCSFFID